MPPVPLMIGIDIGKNAHVAALLSSDLLARHKTFDRCPVLPFPNSRPGFERLLRSIVDHAQLSSTQVLVEATGHYGLALEAYLQEHGIPVYRIHMQRKHRRQKSDKRDARALAVLLYNQTVLHAPVVDPDQQIRRLVTPSSTAVQLRGLVRHRLELVRETTQRKNKLIALADELFPEMVQVYEDLNSPSALALRSAFPTPTALVSASIDALAATRKRNLPPRKELERLQELARVTIGTKNPDRLKSIVLEQEYLIRELLLLQDHVDHVTADIEAIVAQSREGQILTSFIGIGPVHASTIIAQMGSIANFEGAAKLRGYMGWSPHQAQTGESYDQMTLTKGGNSTLKHTMYLVALVAIRHDPTWRALYTRLLPLKCEWDPRKREWRGKMKVIGRIAGQMITVIYTLLKRDYDLQEGRLADEGKGEHLPAPEMYSVERHALDMKKGRIQHDDPSRGSGRA